MVTHGFFLTALSDGGVNEKDLQLGRLDDETKDDYCFTSESILFDYYWELVVHPDLSEATDNYWLILRDPWELLWIIG